MNKPKTRLATIVALTLIALALSIPLLTAETSPNWQTAPTFQDTEAYNLTWTLAAGQPSPKIGDTVWAVPNVKNESGTLVPLASASPSPSPAPSAVPFTPDNDAVAVAAVVTIVLVAAMFGTLLAYRSHLSKKAVGAAAVTLLAFSCCAFLPLGSADQTATTGYKLATPTGSWDFQICNYTDNSIGVVRGSDWANFMTFVGYVGGNPSNGLITPPWAGYSENASATWENIFANITYGVIESKEVAVGYTTGLDDWMTALPADVEVVCYYQGNTYQFTNPSNTAGSPYTVKVGEKMLAGNYTAEDAKGRITWTSSNSTYVMNSAAEGGNKTICLASDITNDGAAYWVLYNYTTILGNGHVYKSDGVNGKMIQNADQTSVGNTGIEIYDLTIDMQGATCDTNGAVNLKNAKTFVNGESQERTYIMERVCFINGLNTGLKIWGAHDVSSGGDATGGTLTDITFGKWGGTLTWCFTALWDSSFTRMHFDSSLSAGTEWTMSGCQACTVTDPWFGYGANVATSNAQLYMVSCSKVNIKGLWSAAAGYYAIFLQSCRDCVIDTFQIFGAQQYATTNTKEAITLYLGCANCSFSNYEITIHGVGDRMVKYGFLCDATSTLNIFGTGRVFAGTAWASFAESPNTAIISYDTIMFNNKPLAARISVTNTTENTAVFNNVAYGTPNYFQVDVAEVGIIGTATATSTETTITFTAMEGYTLPATIHAYVYEATM